MAPWVPNGRRVLQGEVCRKIEGVTNEAGATEPSETYRRRTRDIQISCSASATAGREARNLDASSTPLNYFIDLGLSFFLPRDGVTISRHENIRYDAQHLQMEVIRFAHHRSHLSLLLHSPQLFELFVKLIVREC